MSAQAEKKKSAAEKPAERPDWDGPAQNPDFNGATPRDLARALLRPKAVASTKKAKKTAAAG